MPDQNLDAGPGTWRRIAAGLVLLGGFADASLARPDRLGMVDVFLFASGFASVLLFMALGAARPWRLALTGLVGVASAIVVVLDAAEGFTTAEIAIAALDVLLRLALVASLAILAYRHVGRRRSLP